MFDGTHISRNGNVKVSSHFAPADHPGHMFPHGSFSAECGGGATCAAQRCPSPSRRCSGWPCHPIATAQTDFPDQSRFQKVHAERPSGRADEPRGAARRPRAARGAHGGAVRIHNPRTGLNTVIVNMADTVENPRGLYQHDEEGLQGIAIDPNFEENRWVYLYYSPRLNTPTDVSGTGINEGDAPETLNTPEDRARLALFAANPQTSYMLLSRFKFQGSDARPLVRAGDHPRARQAAASAATSAARSTSTARATCTCRRATTRTRSSRRATCRSTIARTATRRSTRGARRATRTTCAARSCASASGTNGSYAIPQRQPVPAQPGAHAAGDLRDGLPQPVPLRGQPPQRRRLRRRLLAGRPGGRTRRAGRRAHGRWMLVRRPGQLRLAVLHDAGPAVRRLRLHARRTAVGRGVQLQPADQRLAQQHRPAAAAAGACSRTSGTATRRATTGCSPSCSSSAAGDGIGPMGGPAYDSTAAAGRRCGGRGCSTATRCSTSGRATT